MSYVNKKTRAFRDVRDIELVQKRSDGRMKTYPSATDARCWVDNTEQKRQYILELVSRQGDGKGLSLGKFIPIEAIIDILLANKNAEIKSLQDEIEQLKQFIKTHGMNAPPPPRPKKAKPKAKSDHGGKATSVASRKSGEKDSDYPDEKMDREKEDESVIGRPIDYESELASNAGGTTKRSVSVSEGRVGSAGRGIDDRASALSGVIEDRQMAYDPSGSAGEGRVDGDAKSVQSKTSTGTGRPASVKSGSGRVTPDDTTVTSDVSGPFGTPTENELAAAVDFLAGKTSDEQVAELKKALAEQAKQMDLALAAIEQLENVKDIAEDKSERNPRWDKRPSGQPGETGRADENRMLGGQDTENLKGRLADLRGLEDQIEALKKKLGGADGEMEKLKCRCNDDEKSMKNMQKELEKLRCKMRKCEILQCERDCLKCRVDDLMRVQRDYEDLLQKTKGFDAIKTDCCMYKHKYEELKSMEDELNELRAKNEKFMRMEEEKALLMQEISDCECCMSGQEDEIKRLACHIECLTKDLDKRQDDMKTKVVTMRACLRNKDDLISSSEQKLAVVQDELRSSIENVSVETTNLRHRIAELEQQLVECRKANCTCDLQATIDELKIENCRLNTCLANMGDEHVHKMLRHANKAMECLTERINAGIKAGPPKEEPRSEPVAQPSVDDELIKRNQQLLAELNEAKLRLEELQKQLGMGEDELLKKIQALQDELNQAKKTIDLLQSIPAASDDRGAPDQSDLIDSLKKRIDQLEGELATCRGELANCKAVQDENSALRDSSSKLQDLAKEQLAKSEAENEALRQRLADLQRELENEMKLRGAAEELMKEQAAAAARDGQENDRLKELNDNLSDEIRRLKDELAKLNAEYNKLKSECGLMKDELDGLKKEADKLKSEKDKLNDQLAAARSANDDEIKGLKDEIKGLKDEINRLKKELAAANAAAEANRLSAADADKFAKEREELLRQIAAQKKEIADMLKKMQQPVAEDDSGRKELENKQKEVDKLKSLIDDLEKQLKACKDSAAAGAVPKPPDLNEIINNLTKRLDSEEQRTRDLEDQLKKCREENDKLRHQKGGETARPPSPVKKPERPPSPIKKPERPPSPVKKPEPKRPSSPVKKPKDDDCEERLKKLQADMDAQKKQYEQAIDNLKGQHAKDKSAILAQNKASIENLQKSHDNITKELEEKHDQELASMKKGLKSKPPAITNKVVIKKKKDKPVKEEKEEEEPVKIEVVKPPIVTEEDEKPAVTEDPRKSILATTPGMCPCGRLPTILPIPSMPSDHRIKRPSPIPPPSWLQQRSAYITPQPRQMAQEQPHMQYQKPSGMSSTMPNLLMDNAIRPCTCSKRNITSDGSDERPLTGGVVKDNEEKMKSIKKIAELENKLMSKQLQTKQKVDLLQTTVDRFKRELELEKQKNSDLTSRYTNQSKTVENMMMEINLVKQENINDKKKLHQLNTTLRTMENDMFRSAAPAYGNAAISNPCICARVARAGQGTSIPHFHTELTIKNDEVRSGKKKSLCTCSRPSTAYSSDIDE